MVLECKRCGKCCEYIATVFDPATISPEVEHYLEVHGCTIDAEQGLILIPSRCQYLMKPNKKGQQFCKIYMDRPDLCRRFGKNTKGFYIPKGCAYE